MRYELIKAAASMPSLAFAPKTPSITGVTRLETQPTSVGFQAGLAAPLADPLWLLARQWQFNEFAGEDAGTPLNLAFEVNGTKVDAFRAGSKAETPWQQLAEGGVPIETRVEAESAWTTHPRLRGEAGQHALRMAASPLRAVLLAGYPLDLKAPADADADRDGQRWSMLLRGRTIDSKLLADDLRPLRDGAGELTALPAAWPLDGVDADAARAMLAGWLRWLDALLYEGDAQPASWQPNRMEYAFSLRAGDTGLAADEYTDGHVDWDDFSARAADPPVEAIQQTFAVRSRHPAPVRYPGMPAERFWEFEDGDVNFAGAEAGVTDLLRLSVTEFALTFGNDWFVVPVRLPVGWLHRVTRFVITDSFGVPAEAKPIANAQGTQWTLYSLTAEQGRLEHTLFLPDSLDGVQEGAVLEHTMLVRDEMANLAWAIERTVQGESGEPLDRTAEAHALAFQQRIDFKVGENSPQLVYRLQTPVPANWIPLVPVRKSPLNLNDPLSIRLERAGMKRFYPEATVEVVGHVDNDYAEFLKRLDAQTNFIDSLAIDDALRCYTFHPRGWLLRSDPRVPMEHNDSLLFIEEEEVPRIGVTLKRKFQYARSSDGRSWLWVGRSKIAGRGEARSALRYDVAVKRDTLR
jgi:hypothetical protein